MHRQVSSSSGTIGTIKMLCIDALLIFHRLDISGYIEYFLYLYYICLKAMLWFSWNDCLPTYAFRYWHVIHKNSSRVSTSRRWCKSTFTLIDAWEIVMVAVSMNNLCILYIFSFLFLSKVFHNPYRYIVIHFSHKPFLSEFGYVI